MTVEFGFPDYTYRVKVDRVIDGDTVDVYIDLGFKMTVFKRLRLLELDTEELRDRNPDNRAKANAAKVRLEEILREADKVFVKTVYDSTGKYGRLLAWLWVEKDGVLTNINEQMVAEGFQKQ